MADDKITSAGTSDKKISCSFCGKSQEEVKKLIAGPNVYILEIMGNSGVVEEFLMVKLPPRFSTEISEVE